LSALDQLEGEVAGLSGVDHPGRRVHEGARVAPGGYGLTPPPLQRPGQKHTRPESERDKCRESNEDQSTHPHPGLRQGGSVGSARPFVHSASANGRAEPVNSAIRRCRRDARLFRTKARAAMLAP
jgi:hypothetical protein